MGFQYCTKRPLRIEGRISAALPPLFHSNLINVIRPSRRSQRYILCNCSRSASLATLH